MLLTCQTQPKANPTGVFRHGLNNTPPQHTGFAEIRRVAKNVESTSSSRQCNANSVFDLQKTDVAASVAPDKREEYHFVLFALVRVYCDNAKISPLQVPVLSQLSQD